MSRRLRYGDRVPAPRRVAHKNCLATSEARTEDIPATAADGTETTQRVVQHLALCGDWLSFKPWGNPAFRNTTCPECLAVWDRANPATGGGEP